MPKRKSWRDVYPVHPAADVFPLMSEEELTELAQDIKKNGLQTPILLWEEVTEAPKEVGDKRKKGKVYVLDGRNRLDALEKLGLPLLTEKGEFTNTGISSKGIYKWKRVISSKEFFWGMGNLEGRPSVKHASDPATIVISANIKRRHLIPAQRAKLAAEAIKADREFKKGVSEKSFKNPKGGRPRGDVSRVAEQADVSVPTARKAVAEVMGRKPKKESVTKSSPKPKPKKLDPHSREGQRAFMEAVELAGKSRGGHTFVFNVPFLFKGLGPKSPLLARARLPRGSSLSGTHLPISWPRPRPS